mmetsp:Transcript_4754/g.11583  ORF Transcript_4754/g.11583 Transcript_4754/m.11583 type:complete len:83 (-) Transcript_4754:74-322(-)
MDLLLVCNTTTRKERGSDARTHGNNDSTNKHTPFIRLDGFGGCLVAFASEQCENPSVYCFFVCRCPNRKTLQALTLALRPLS